MNEKINLYNEEGQVNDPEIAREMANVEDPYHKKRFGFLNPSQDKLKEGEMEAEKIGDHLQEEKIRNIEKQIKQEKMNEQIENIGKIFENLLYLGIKEGKIIKTGTIRTPGSGGYSAGEANTYRGEVELPIGEDAKLSYKINGAYSRDLLLNGMPVYFDDLDLDNINKILDKILINNENYREIDQIENEKNKADADLRHQQYMNEMENRKMKIKEIIDKI